MLTPAAGCCSLIGCGCSFARTPEPQQRFHHVSKARPAEPRDKTHAFSPFLGRSGVVNAAASKPAPLRRVQRVPGLSPLRSASVGGLSIARLKCQEGFDYVTFNGYTGVPGRGRSTLALGVDGCRQDSGDCMSR